jgi:hypothetical protein
VPLHWQYWLAPGENLPERNPKNPKFRALISVWKKLPLRIAGAIGPHIARSLP